MQQRSHSGNPQVQPVKGIFVFSGKGEDAMPKALDLLKSMHCRVLSSLNNRITITTSRGNLQKIKQSWLSKSEKSSLSVALKQQVSHIIIGGDVNH